MPAAPVSFLYRPGWRKVDAGDLKSPSGNGVRVRVPPWACTARFAAVGTRETRGISAVRARDAGMDVVYEGIRLTPAEIVEAVRALPARDLILDCEIISLTPDGRPQPFQVTARRFGRKLDLDRMR